MTFCCALGNCGRCIECSRVNYSPITAPCSTRSGSRPSWSDPPELTDVDETANEEWVS